MNTKIKKQPSEYRDYIHSIHPSLKKIIDEEMAEEMFFILLAAKIVGCQIYTSGFDKTNKFGTIYKEFSIGRYRRRTVNNFVAEKTILIGISNLVSKAFDKCLKGDFGIDRWCEEEALWCQLLILAYENFEIPDFFWYEGIEQIDKDYFLVEQAMVEDFYDSYDDPYFYIPLRNTIEQHAEDDSGNVFEDFGKRFLKLTDKIPFRENPLSPIECKFLYLMKCERTGFYKIGVSKSPKHREMTLAAQEPLIKLVGQWENLGYREHGWHKHFSEQRIRGEWFKLTKAQVAYFCKKNCDEVKQCK